ncbi:histone-lysine N-methyltransferase SETMAR [Trichonephila clavipes]|uniref:Histone-lysine N-methyltransferase SETMAR n=1 Tax=Trichonephila clavipes TaxID=2585209 RepID=A0A8X6VJK7_TRICX|nr:histone-lysine N-methyltransferase SETMAR [Trichonephila clavipes]
MLTIFWDASGVLYSEFLTKGLTVNSDRYCATLRSLKHSIYRIRPNRNVFLLHHYNARPHCCAQKQNVIGKLKFTVVPQPPYSLDLSLLEFWLFPKLKETLKGQGFATDVEIPAAVHKWRRSQPESFFMDEMKKLIERLNKCVSFTCRNCGGGDGGRVAIYRPFGEFAELNRTVTCMVFKANDRRTSSPLPR